MMSNALRGHSTQRGQQTQLPLSPTDIAAGELHGDHPIEGIMRLNVRSDRHLSPRFRIDNRFRTVC